MQSTKRTGRRRALPCALVVLMLAAAVVAGCGSSGGAATASSATTGSLQQRFFQARLQFARCLRRHGVDVPDPTPGRRPGAGGGAFRRLRDDPSAQSAIQDCRSVLRNAFGSISPQQRAQFQQQAVRFAQCLRAHGVNVPDPTEGQGGGFGIRRALGSVDRNSPQVQSALAACRGQRPRFGGGPPPPGGGAPQ